MARARGIRVQHRGWGELDALGAQSRARLAPDVPLDEAVDVLAVLERLEELTVKVPGSDGARATIHHAPTPLPTRVLARVMYEAGHKRFVIEVDDRVDDPESTYKKLLAGDPSARFTALHEVGHLKLHLAELVHMTSLPHDQIALARSKQTHPPICDSETQANRYAAAFLAPDAGLRLLQRSGHLNRAAVMIAFGLNASTAKYRINNFLEMEACRR